MNARKEMTLNDGIDRFISNVYTYQQQGWGESCPCDQPIGVRTEPNHHLKVIEEAEHT